MKIMRHNRRFLWFLLGAIAFIFSSCGELADALREEKESGQEKKNVTECPVEIRERAFHFAELYENADTYYKYGGQDPLRSIGIDCSGLVVMSYKYAITDTKYGLMEADMSSAYMESHASKKTTSPMKGDLIFMGKRNTSRITHVAIFEKIENGMVWFIDSTEYDSDGDGIVDISGVSRRSYPVCEKKIKSYGTMKLRY